MAFVVRLQYLAILFNGPSKPETCWSSRSWELCEKLILTLGAQNDLDASPGSFDLNPSAVANY